MNADIDYADVHSDLLRALYEWQNAGGSLDRVIVAIGALVEYKLNERDAKGER